MRSIKLAFLFILLLGFSRAQGAHIIGGELSYKCLGGITYEITLKVYRDCAGSGASFDNPAHIFMYDNAGSLLTTLQIFNPSVILLPVDPGNPCLDVPPGICVQEGVYRDTVNIPIVSGGVTLVYQRCCRNASILNLVLPDDQGATYVAEIPDTSVAICNSSPQFNNFPPIVICNNEPIGFDHSAFDADGDSLVYELCAPFLGASPAAPMPDLANPAPPPPYLNVNYAFPYTAATPLLAVPPLAIDPQTGWLTGTPTGTGRFVVGVCVKEYRNGILIGSHLRDFQFNIAACEPIIVASLPSFVLDCEDHDISWVNTSTGADTYFWDFGDPSSTTDTSGAFIPPTYTYPDTGTYTVMLVANPGFICADTAFATISVYPTLIGGFDFVAGCSGDPVIFTDTSVSTGSGVINSWDWSFGDAANSSDQNPEHEYADGGTYNVVMVVGTDKGCADTIIKAVEVVPGPDADFLVDDLCQNETAFFDNLTTISSGTTITGWQWDFGDGGNSNDENPSYDYADAGLYTVTLIASTSSGCADTFSADLLVGLVPDAEAGPGDTLAYGSQIIVQGSGNGTYMWVPPLNLSDPSIATPLLTAWQSQTYVLTVTSADGCTSTDSVHFEVLPEEIIELPNAFSPNGDGINDVFSLIYNDIASLQDFSIYNRWGELVFQTTDLNAGWDGTYQGKEQEMGTYIYIVKALGTEGHQLSKRGSFTLVR